MSAAVLEFRLLIYKTKYLKCFTLCQWTNAVIENQNV